MAGTAGRAPAGKLTGPKLRVNWIACDGRGLCAELLPELVGRDEWGYPIIADAPVPPHLSEYAQRAVTICPKLALRLVPPG
ncbi:MAG: ferredoxin [Frankiaceae bacterium]|jgi:ferredoxin